MKFVKKLICHVHPERRAEVNGVIAVVRGVKDFQNTVNSEESASFVVCIEIWIFCCELHAWCGFIKPR